MGRRELMMKKRRIMLDGALVGTELIGSLELKDSEVSRIKIILDEAGAEERDGGLSMTVQGRSDMVVSLRTHFHNKSKFFLNISGNPLTFLVGSNVYGYAEADRVIVTAFRKALEAIGIFPARVLGIIAARDINVHSLEFATYTNKLRHKAQLLNDWAYMYQTSYSSVDGLDHHTLADMLNLRFVRKDKTHRSSVCLRILSGDGREEEAMLEAYDKALQMREVGKSLGRAVLVPSDIENRIRLDLNLNQGWFRRRQVGGRKLKTLRDLVAYVGRKHMGDWSAFLKHEFEWAVARTNLFYMWAFDAESAMDGPSKIDHAMVKARALMRVSDREWNEMIAHKKRLRSVDLDPHPEKLCLEMGEL